MFVIFAYKMTEFGIFEKCWPDRYPFFRAGGDLRLHDNENMRPIDYTRRLEANSKFKKEMLQFLEQQQESFSNFQRTRQKIELGTPHRVKLTKPAKTSGMFGKNYGTFNYFWNQYQKASDPT